MKKIKTFLLLYLLINLIGGIPILVYFLIFGELDKFTTGIFLFLISVLSVIIPARVNEWIGVE